MKTTKKKEYVAPELEAVSLYSEGCACQIEASGEIEPGGGD